MYNYRALVLDVIDGDTVRLDVDLGFSIRTKQVFRLVGIDAPELHGTHDPAPGQAAKNYLASLLAPGSTIAIQTEKDKKEKYGRYLVDITLPDGSSVSELMIQMGHAKPYRGGPR